MSSFLFVFSVIFVAKDFLLPLINSSNFAATSSSLGFEFVGNETGAPDFSVLARGIRFRIAVVIVIA